MKVRQVVRRETKGQPNQKEVELSLFEDETVLRIQNTSKDSKMYGQK